MTLEALISAFLNYIKVEKGLAANTISAYAHDLRKFAKFATQRKLSLAEVSRGDLIEFFGSLYREHLDSRSVARHLVSLRNLFRFALIEGVLTADPTLNLESPKVRKSLPTYLRMEEVDRLLAQPDVATPYGVRDRAMIEVLDSDRLARLRIGRASRLRPGHAHGLLALHREG